MQNPFATVQFLQTCTEETETHSNFISGNEPAYLQWPPHSWEELVTPKTFHRGSHWCSCLQLAAGQTDNRKLRICCLLDFVLSRVALFRVD